LIEQLERLRERERAVVAAGLRRAARVDLRLAAVRDADPTRRRVVACEVAAIAEQRWIVVHHENARSRRLEEADREQLAQSVATGWAAVFHSV
jgi:hypothetical protein